MGTDGCRLDGLVDVIGKEDPRHEGLKVGPRIHLAGHFGSTMHPERIEFCLSIICKRKI